MFSIIAFIISTQVVLARDYSRDYQKEYEEALLRAAAAAAAAANLTDHKTSNDTLPYSSGEDNKPVLFIK